MGTTSSQVATEDELEAMKRSPQRRTTTKAAALKVFPAKLASFKRHAGHRSPSVLFVGGAVGINTCVRMPRLDARNTKKRDSRLRRRTTSVDPTPKRALHRQNSDPGNSERCVIPCDTFSFVPAIVRDRFASGRSSLVGAEWSDPFDGGVLLLDISGYTALTKWLGQNVRNGAEEMSAALTSYFSAVLKVVRARDGDVYVVVAGVQRLRMSGACIFSAVIEHLCHAWLCVVVG